MIARKNLMASSQSWALEFSGQFDGTNDEFERNANNGTPTDETNYIASMWCKINNAASVYGTWMMNTVGRIGEAPYMTINTSSSYTVFMGGASTNAQYNGTSGTITTNWQHHLTSFSYSASSGSRFRHWIDGSEITMTQTYWSGGIHGLLKSGYRFTFGYAYWDHKGEWFDGKMCQLAVLDGVSIQNGDYTIAHFYNNGPRDLSGLTYGNNGFLINDPSTGVDSSGNGNNMTVNGVTQSTDVP